MDLDLVSFPLVGGGEIEVNHKDILFFEAYGNISTMAIGSVNSIFNQRYIDISLGELVIKLSDHKFYRIHRSYLVNVSRILPYGNYPSNKLKVSGGLEIPISRRRKLDFHNYYLQMTTHK